MTAILQVLKPIPVKEYKAMLKKSKSKYGNKKVIVDGIKFDSKKESQRYVELKLMLKVGIISCLQMQVKYELPACNYVADFVYLKDDILIVEDVKGVKTAMYKLKKKLMKLTHGIEIKET